MTPPAGVPPLISTEWLNDHIDDPSLVVVEVAFAPRGSPESSAGGHIPGSHVVWWKELCWHDTDRRFPDPPTMAARLEDFGVADDSTLVLAGDPIQFATYLYWVLVMTGLDHVAGVLDGGLNGWRSERRPTTETPVGTRRRGRLRPLLPDQTVGVGRDDVLAGLGQADRVLVDFRSIEEYRGERVAPTTAPFDHGAERKGHIPGAVHLPHDRLLDHQGRFRPRADLEAEFERLGTEESVEMIAYCRLSHRASLGWFAATRVAGRHRVRVYDGSWTEWGSIVGFPVEN